MTWQIGLIKPIFCWIRTFGAGHASALSETAAAGLSSASWPLLRLAWVRICPSSSGGAAHRSASGAGFFGGVDLDNLTCRVLQALLDPALAHLAVDVVLGCNAPTARPLQSWWLVGPTPPCIDPYLVWRFNRSSGPGNRSRWCHYLGSELVFGFEPCCDYWVDNQLPFTKALEQANHLQLSRAMGPT